MISSTDPIARRPIGTRPAPTAAPPAAAATAPKVAARASAPAPAPLLQRVLGGIAGLSQTLKNGAAWAIYGRMPEGLGGFKVTDWANPALQAKANPQAAAARRQAALSERAANAEAERAARTALAARAESYDRLASLIDADPLARRALQNLLLTGRLTGPNATTDLLARLDAAARQPLVPGLDRAALLADLVNECDDPARIAQGDKNSCTATAATILVARREPAEYARLVGELARPAGVARLADGATIHRAPNWADPGDGSRGPTVKLLQPALIEHGNGPLRYDLAGDANRLPRPLSLALAGVAAAGAVLAFRFGRRLLAIELGAVAAGVACNWFGSGLIGPQAGHMVESLTGRKWRSQVVWRGNRDGAFAKLEAAVKQGQAVPCAIWLPIGGHQVLVEKIAGGLAHLVNPWGMRNTLPVAELKARVVSVNLPA